MELLTNDHQLTETEDEEDNESLACHLQYTAKLLRVTAITRDNEVYGVKYWTMSRTRKIGLTDRGEVLDTKGSTFREALALGRLHLRREYDTVVDEISRLLVLCT